MRLLRESSGNRGAVCLKLNWSVDSKLSYPSHLLDSFVAITPTSFLTKTK